ncbi:winged helix-turn-helix domain-containing protein [Vibrio crassostreae]|uniref:winged helix-turn-helix domain-containing protein n=1 Tax=Vibrio crassostreae TaxID=246167 RepID=UPI0006305021|nr:winged helix-turn-helix domain-containing protein [Vibrio crassostreae]ROO50086.1 DNA-binding winged helix-turn-helix (wHTH) protein [Vibrio crassostreae]ROO65526.1 DNA-binding winged helix-turn-helix (wHTH) protein [Vibrio crassostreae]ROO69558.1 DNA-binding winged helix-turn-helix (wHTH) protein [Vibrio crassostreae]ROO71099.1 DNA-binding winged helix-turn-helix (wHTH) protein [Vibrio crassostreae]ROP10989.1 DNA-binding winged helix-turn-helix (wHTH) protein [Vibrio crassostreae]
MTKLTLEPPVYLIGEYLYSSTSGVLSKNDNLTRLRAKESALLNALINRVPDVLSRENIVQELYENTYATDATINQLVKRLRKAMSDDQRSLIRTIPKQGYLLAIDPKLVEERPHASPEIPAKYLTVEHGDFDPIDVDIEELNRVTNRKIAPQDESRLQRFGAATVIGCLLFVAIGYGLGACFAPSARYLDQISVGEAETQHIDTLSQTPTVVIDKDQQVVAIYLKDDEETVHCEYQEQVTLCN